MIALAILFLACPQAYGERLQERVPTVQDPKIVLDGLIQEPAWEQALLLDDFLTVEPEEGLAVDPPWEVRILRTDVALYLAMTFYEPEPERMVLQNERRDAVLEEDDRIEFLFDTFADGKTAYFFQVSAGGSRGDALIGDNGRRFNKPWNGFWEASVIRLPDRWVAEVRIPFDTMSFGSGDVWRANFERFRGADRSISRWSGARRAFRLSTVNQARELAGFAGAQQGLGVEFRPFLKLDGRDGSLTEDDGFHLDGGGEVSWRLTPQLTAAMTWNTDFAETEVDERRVNLSRFPLFFPEKRDFFLQDSTLFQFGEQGGQFGSGGGNLVPFFSRRIGLVDDSVVPIEAGARLAGRAGPWDLGFLGVRTEEVAGIGVPAGDLFVLRPALRVGEEVTVGGLLTSGSPATDASNTVVGGDVRWSSSTWLPGNFNLNAFVVGSDDEATDSTGLGFGVEANYRNEDWIYALRTLGSHEDFQPALGFVQRPGEWLTTGSVEWQPRPASSTVRNYAFSIDPTIWTDLNGDLVSGSLRVTPFEVEWHNGDQFEVAISHDRDIVDTDFEISDGVIIPAGSYDWQRLQLEYQWSEARPVSGKVEVRGGSFYDGDILSYETEANWRPHPRLRLGLGYEENLVSLPDGDFATRLAQMRCDIGFSPQLAWQSLLQADNESDTLGVQSRLHWILEDGRELFLVVQTEWERTPDGTIVPEERQLAIKLVWAVRF